MKLNRRLFDMSKISNISLKGRGGCEKIIAEYLLPDWKLVNQPLHDFEINRGRKKIRLEVKKQENLQWFDAGKYHELSEVDREILMLFLLHKQGVIDVIVITSLGEFLDWLLEHKCATGWNAEVLRVGDDLKKKHPGLQFKVPAKIADILKAAPDLFDVLYRRVNNQLPKLKSRRASK